MSTANDRCMVNLIHRDQSESRCTRVKTRQEHGCSHIDEHGCSAPILVSQATIDEVRRVTESAPVTNEPSRPEQPPSGEGLCVGALREALIDAMDLGGAWGANLHESKDVVIQAGDQFWSLGQVAVSFRAGRSVLVLKAVTP
jgi:hypothetical protein